MYVCIYLSFSVCSIHFSQFIFLSLSLSLLLSLSLSLSLLLSLNLFNLSSISFCMYVCMNVSIYLSIYLSQSIYLSIYLSISFYLSIYLYQPSIPQCNQQNLCRVNEKWLIGLFYDMSTQILCHSQFDNYSFKLYIVQKCIFTIVGYVIVIISMF